METNSKIKGIPLTLILFVLVILAPILIGDIVLFRIINGLPQRIVGTQMAQMELLSPVASATASATPKSSSSMSPSPTPTPTAVRVVPQQVTVPSPTGVRE